MDRGLSIWARLLYFLPKREERMRAVRNLVLLLLLAIGAAAKGRSVVLERARFTVLTPTLLRLEYSPEGKFEDRPSVLVVNRKFPPVSFKVERAGKWLRILTRNLVLEYEAGSGPFNSRNLRIRYLVSGKFEEWRPGRPDPLNLGGTRTSLDLVGEHNLPDLPPGLLSRSGCFLLQDQTPLWDEGKGWIVKRPEGYLDWYFFGYGLDYQRALEEFVTLCGRIPMLPKWAFGSWYSRYWPYTEAEERELILRFREEGLPLDVLVIDVDWHLHGWHGWDWNPKYFPNPSGFLRWARERGVKVTLNIHPGVLPKSDSHFPKVCKRLGIDPRGVKDAYKFDLAKKEEAEAYMEVLHKPLLDQGVEFFWIDGWCGARMSGLSPLLWTNKIYYEFQERHLRRRTLILSRYGGWGNHRYPVAFSGDTFSEWGVLNYEVYFTATAGNVGVAYWSHDIGGFFGKKLPVELYVRWVQFGALSPILRLHSDHGVREPWNYGRKALSICRNFYRLRYRLIPYLYTLSRLTYERGLPLCRPLYLHWPGEEWAYRYRHQYLLGEGLLVAPVAEPTEDGFSVKEVCFPPGIWHDIFTGKVYKGPKALIIRCPLWRMPLYAREGTILPLAPDVDFVGQKPLDPLTILYFAGRDGAFDLYEDDGESLGYKRGECSWTPIVARERKGRLVITVGPTRGHYRGQLERRRHIIRVVGRPAPVKVLVGGHLLPEVSLNGLGRVEVGWAFDPSRFETIVKLPPTSIKKRLEVSFIGGPGVRAYGLVRQLLTLSARLWEAREAGKFVPLPGWVRTELEALHEECGRIKALFGRGEVPLEAAARKASLIERRVGEMLARLASQCKDPRALKALLGALWGLSAKARIVKAGRERV
ncbi:MAG TPA: DUF5110 domain-containing protein, partial [Armatimonadetes bacterium]|nr:DUF5110 domain-containing protein [Armatimonadota bacterium]